MASLENLEMIQSNHKIQLEIKISRGPEDRKCLSGFWKPLYKTFTSSILQKQQLDIMDTPNLKERKGLEILANLEFVEQKWPAAEH